MSEKRLYLIRHGHTTWNGPPARMQGNKGDSQLSERGRAEATALGPAMPAFDRIVSSPLTRCLQTVDCLFGRAPDATDPRLAEIDVGSFTGRYASEIRETEPEAWRVWRAMADDGRIGGDGETIAELQQRFLAGVRDVLAGIVDGERVLVATHGGCLRTLIFHAEGRPLSDFHATKVENLTLFEATQSAQGNLSVRLVTAGDIG